MAKNIPNKKEDGYCFTCRKDVAPDDLIQCDICENWFCENNIDVIEDPQSLDIQMITACSKDQGKPTFD